MSETQTATIQTEVPLGLLTEVQKMVDAGWFRSLDEVILDALRRFVESHRTELIEEFIREDMEWGLRGDE
jgi:Arc/MetJ-type ribon-helix-helix transcriptional regulator